MVTSAKKLKWWWGSSIRMTKGENVRERKFVELKELKVWLKDKGIMLKNSDLEMKVVGEDIIED